MKMVYIIGGTVATLFIAIVISAIISNAVDARKRGEHERQRKIDEEVEEIKQKVFKLNRPKRAKVILSKYLKENAKDIARQRIYNDITRLKEEREKFINHYRNMGHLPSYLLSEIGDKDDEITVLEDALKLIEE
jgi:hypothetical protein